MDPVRKKQIKTKIRKFGGVSVDLRPNPPPPDPTKKYCRRLADNSSTQGTHARQTHVVCTSTAVETRHGTPEHNIEGGIRNKVAVRQKQHLHTCQRPGRGDGASASPLSRRDPRDGDGSWWPSERHPIACCVERPAKLEHANLARAKEGKHSARKRKKRRRQRGGTVGV